MRAARSIKQTGLPRCARNDKMAIYYLCSILYALKNAPVARFLFNPCAHDRCMFDIACADFMM